MFVRRRQILTNTVTNTRVLVFFLTTNILSASFPAHVELYKHELFYLCGVKHTQKHFRKVFIPFDHVDNIEEMLSFKEHEIQSHCY